MKKNLIKLIILSLFYVVTIFIVIFGGYYFQFKIDSVFPYLLISIVFLLTMALVLRLVTKKKNLLVLYGITLLVAFFPVKYLAITIFDLYLFTNEDVRSVYVEQAVIIFIDALKNEDENMLRELSSEGSDFCEGESFRMATSTYKNYFSKNISDVQINVSHSNHEDSDLFNISFTYLDGSIKKQGEITGITILRSGKLYICGEYY